MERRCALALACLLALVAGGCGGGSSSTGHRRTPHKEEPEIVEDGVGMSAPIKAYVVAHRSGPRHVQRAPHIMGASPCFASGRGGLANIDLLSDVPSPRRLLVSPGERILVVNRSGAFFKHDRSVRVLRLGDFVARIGPQEAALFPAPVGSYLAFGLHGFGGHGGVATPGVLVVEKKCNRQPGGLSEPLSRCL